MRIAIVGSGISGMVAAHLLQRRHDIQVFEAGEHIGGHTYTVPVQEGERELPVDIGFIVYNEKTYPNFCRLMRELKVETQPSDMSFGVRSERTGLEYCGSSSLNQLFAQRSNLVRPSFYRMLAGIVRFHRKAPELLTADPGLTLGEYVRREGFKGPFLEHYLIPMIASIWSTDPTKMFEFPARTLARFLDNHGMLQIVDRPQWRVVKGGSRSYVKRLTESFADRIHLRTPVTRVKRRTQGVEVKLGSGDTQVFDTVVFATHSDQALRLLGDPTRQESEILSAIPYQPNDVVLHTDTRLMPKRRLAWASWNYHLDLPSAPRSERLPNPEGTRLTYWMNRLQSLESNTEYLVSLNRTDAIDPRKILHRVTLDHPLFLRHSEQAKARWSEINRERTFFCGAYWGFGFHEDGVKSGLRVAAALGESW